MCIRDSPIAAKVKDVDNDMRYTFINKKAEELFEYPAKEAIGRTDFDIMPEATTKSRLRSPPKPSGLGGMSTVLAHALLAG